MVRTKSNRRCLRRSLYRLQETWSDKILVCLFFFSSRRRHTRFDCDWSSDVCSSDLGAPELGREPRARDVHLAGLERHVGLVLRDVVPVGADGVEAGALGAERGLEKHGIGGEDGDDLIHGAVLPPAAKRFQQLAIGLGHGAQYTRNLEPPVGTYGRREQPRVAPSVLAAFRSEERRVGKECRSRWSPY